MNVIRAGAGPAWADTVARRLVQRLRDRPSLRLCLPTGLTPVPIYGRVAGAVRRGEASFRTADVFLLDEFGDVAHDDPGRCDQMLWRFLLNDVDLPRERFHGFDLAGDIDETCRAYESLAGGGFDLTLLGIGTNGHVGMNEPGSAADSLTRRVALAPETIAASARYFTHGGLPTWGVTIGVGTIARSREIWVLACGAAKAEIVRTVIEGPVTPDVPATLLRNHPNADFLLDDEAARLLGRST
jgi:glucosamine-6-phosphate deaminase